MTQSPAAPEGTNGLSAPGLLALMLGHCAGILFLISLPVWVGTLAGQYGFDLPSAGILATSFMLGASMASLLLAPRFRRLDARRVATVGFGLATVLFLLAPQRPTFGVLFGAFVLAGLCTGAALSAVHGTIGVSNNPHRVYALAGLAIGLVSTAFLGGMPGLVTRLGGAWVFYAYAAITALATLGAWAFYPAVQRPAAHASQVTVPAPMGRAVWFVIIAVALMGTTQAMTLSLFERIGVARGFSIESVSLALAGLGLATLFPAPLAAMLQHRVAATAVVSVTPIFQAVFAQLITHAPSYGWYASGAALMEFNILFTHTFAFGLLARLDPTGRAVAGTPAMVMLGAAIGPALGGTLADAFGFPAVGLAAMAFVLAQVLLFNLTRRAVTPAPIAPQTLKSP